MSNLLVIRGVAPLKTTKGKVMERTITLNADDMGCEHGTDSRVTCGTCQRNWCDICNPTPSARCLYEYEHDDLFEDTEGVYGPDPTLDDEYSPFGRGDKRTTQITEEDEALLVLEAEAGYAVEELKARPELLPRVGMMVSYHSKGQYRIVETDKYDDDPGWVKLDNGQEVDFFNCCEVLFNQPCPTCGEPNGFHDDEKHRKDIDPKYLLKKGWHLERVKE